MFQRPNTLTRLLSSSLLPLLLARGAFYQDIKAHSVAWKTGGVCSTKVGNRPGNTKKNRYKDVVPCKSLGVFRESGSLAQTLGGSARVAAATRCPAPTLRSAEFYLPYLRQLHYSLKPQGADSYQCSLTWLAFALEAFR